MRTVNVYLPNPAYRRTTVQTVRAGSAIVGTPVDDDVVIDFEGNIYGAGNMTRYVERCLHAAGRHTTGYSTVARAVIPKGAVQLIGTFDGKRVAVDSHMVEYLATWLGVVELDPKELTL